MSDAAVSVESSGRFAIGRWRVHRTGFGAMQLAGDGVVRPPRDRAEAVAVLRQAVADGVAHIDTAQYYGPGVVNELIREALHPYPSGLAIVSKVAARRDDTGAVLPFDEPHQLRQGIEDNLRTLATLPCQHGHPPDLKVPVPPDAPGAAPPCAVTTCRPSVPLRAMSFPAADAGALAATGARAAGGAVGAPSRARSTAAGPLRPGRRPIGGSRRSRPWPQGCP